MSGPGYQLQLAVAATLLADATTVSLVAPGAAGPAIFAPHQAFDKVFPRITLETPQVLPNVSLCVDGSKCHVSVHLWGQGATASLDVLKLEDAVRAALNVALAPTGFLVTSFGYGGSHHAGDPDPMIEHRVSMFHYNLQPTPGA